MEISNLLIHITDNSQNTKFQDKYYGGINIDLSKSIFVFSFNDINMINPILKDRLTIIKLDDFNKTEKLTICKHYLLRNILTKFNINDIIFIVRFIT